MRFELKIPEPTTMLVGQEEYIVVPKATVLHRIHPVRFDPVTFNDTTAGTARFSPIYNADSVIPTIYAAQSFATAVCERILRSPDVPTTATVAGCPHIICPSDHADLVYSKIETQMDLNLVSLTTAGQRRLGVSPNALVAGPRSTYPKTRAWAEMIHRSCPTAHGLFYTSLQYGPEYSLVLFGDRLPAGAITTNGSVSVAETVCHDAIFELARSLSIDYVDI